MATAQVSFLQVGDALAGARVSWLQIDGQPEAAASAARVSFLQIDGGPVVLAPAAPTSVEGAALTGLTAELSLTDTNGGTAGYQFQIAPVSTGTWIDAPGGDNPTAPGVIVFPTNGGTPGEEFLVRARATRFGLTSAWVQAASSFFFDTTGEGGGPLPDPVEINFNGPVPSQTAGAGSAVSLNLSSYFDGTLTPFAFTVLSGSLPAGLSIPNPAVPIVSGTVTTVAGYSFAIRGTDSLGNTADTNTISFTVTDASSPVLSSTSVTGAPASANASVTSDEAGTLFWLVNSSSAPLTVPASPAAMTGWTSRALSAGVNSWGLGAITPAAGYYLHVVVQDDEATPNRTTSDLVLGPFTVSSALAAPAVSTHPASTSVAEGATVTLTAAFTGNPTPTLQWRRNGVDLVGATAATHQFTAAQINNGDTYDCVATNTEGTATTNAATLTVFPAVSITQQPANVSITEGQTATFSVVALSQFGVTYQWRRNGVAISGATSASLVMPDVLLSQNGEQYTCTVAALGTTLLSSIATLSVSAQVVPVTIGTNPASVSVLEGYPVTFSVSVTGSQPISYQWRRNGISISGAVGSSYSLSAASLSDNGAVYTVAVTNPFGTVVSAAATLTVSQSQQTGLPYSLELSDWRAGRVVTPSRAPFFSAALMSGGSDYFAFDFSSMLQFDYLVSAEISVARYPMNLGSETTQTITGVVHGGFVAALLSGANRSGQYVVTCRATANGGRILTLPLRLYVIPASGS